MFGFRQNGCKLKYINSQQMELGKEEEEEEEGFHLRNKQIDIK